jgi:flavin reductase (DIM6/NTAB) family NADH-FMN oxidoreductase RutF
MGIDSHEFSDSLFKDALGSLAAGVSVVTASHKGEAIGITVSSFTSLSLAPPLILFSLDIKSKNRAAFSARKKFAVNILSDAQKNLAQHFAAAQKKSWDAIAYTETQHGVRLLKHSIASLSCTVTKNYKHGDHVIIIGKVDAISAVDKHAQPLLYFRRNYHVLGTIKD